MNSNILFHEYFGKLDEQLKGYNIPLNKLLQEGISRDFIDDKIRNTPISFFDELCDLYAWRNGTRFEDGAKMGQTWLFPGGCFLSIEESLRLYRGVNRDIDWKDTMFAVFDSGGGDMYLIDCDEKSPTFKMLIRHNVAAVDYEVVITAYDSLASLFKTITECYETGVFYFDPSGALQSDFKGQIRIARRNNPQSDLWKLYDWVD